MQGFRTALAGRTTAAILAGALALALCRRRSCRPTNNCRPRSVRYTIT